MLVSLILAQISVSPAKPNTTYCYDYVGKLSPSPGYFLQIKHFFVFKFKGCFDNNYPFNNTGYFLPNSPENIGTEFLLYTRNNLDKEEIISYRDPAGIRRSSFNRNLPLKVICHGFGNTKWKPWIHEMKDALLSVH